MFFDLLAGDCKTEQQLFDIDNQYLECDLQSEQHYSTYMVENCQGTTPFDEKDFCHVTLNG